MRESLKELKRESLRELEGERLADKVCYEKEMGEVGRGHMEVECLWSLLLPMRALLRRLLMRMGVS